MDVRNRRRLRTSLALATLTALAGPPLAVSAAPAVAAASAQCPWMDPTLSPDQRASQLVAAMTLDQKDSMLHSAESVMGYYGTAGHIAAIPSLCVPDLLLNDAGAGLGDGQKNVTAFPDGTAQAASWDTTMQQAMGAGLGWEAWHKGINVMLAPAINIARTPLNGRNFEYAGEDPFLAGATGTAVIKGIQSQNVIATLKHYAVNNQETDRMTSSSNLDERTLREIYLAGFETAVKDGKPGSVMCSYNKVNSVYACEHPGLLTDILKTEWGFDGFVMSDWFATHSTARAANAGLDMEMAPLFNGWYFGNALKTAVANGTVPVSRLNDMVTRIVRPMFSVGLFDNPVPSEPTGSDTAVNTPAEATLARRVAEEGTVLLKNTDNVLPLVGKGKKIALIGHAAGTAGAEQAAGGGGSSHVPSVGTHPVVSPQQGITQRGVADSDTVVYSNGIIRSEAVAAARNADVAIVYASDVNAEGTDRTSLSLSNGQDQLISAVAAANPNTVVVLNTGGPVLMPWLHQVKAVVEAWYPGQEGGNAAASVLFGDVNPSGKLPETFPASQSDLPTQTAAQYPGVNGQVMYSEGLLVGYRWYDAKNIAPLFPFGYGLSYTTFGYSRLSVAKTASGANVTFTVTNTGTRAGAEVAQVYVAAPAVSGEPPKQLKGFQKVTLDPGKSTTVTVALDKRAFSRWDTATNAWVKDAGTYQVLVGASSRDIRAQGSTKQR